MRELTNVDCCYCSITITTITITVVIAFINFYSYSAVKVVDDVGD